MTWRRTLAPDAAAPAYAAGNVRRIMVWAPLLLILFWAARYNYLTEIPGYGDALELLGSVTWYANALRTGQNPLFAPFIFYPSGWHTGTLAHTPALLLPMAAASFVLPILLVYNLTVLLAFPVAYAGMQRLVGRYVAPLWVSILLALIYTFWGMRWLRFYSHVNVTWMTALLPWMAWFLVADLTPRRRVWGAGIVWGLAIMASLYGIWLGALVAGVYVLAKPTRRTLYESVGIALIALLVSAPVLAIFWQARQASTLDYYGIEHIAYWGASLNSLFVPAVLHPWWRHVAALIYSGPYDESGIVNFGILLAVVALGGLAAVRRQEWTHRFAVLAAVLGTLLALGPLLRWNGEPVKLAMLTLPDSYLWRLGQILKPEMFPATWPPLFIGAVHLPAYLFYALLPFTEGARVVARFGFVAALGLLPLAGLALARLSWRSVAVGLGLLLLIEGLPWPLTGGVPYPPRLHPALAWLRDQPDANQGAVLDLVVDAGHWDVPIGGEVLYAALQHSKPTVAGVGSFWPKSVWRWRNWLHETPTPLNAPTLRSMLSEFNVKWIAVHLAAGATAREFEKLRSPLFEDIQCWEPLSLDDAWPYPICVLEVADTAD